MAPGKAWFTVGEEKGVEDKAEGTEYTMWPRGQPLAQVTGAAPSPGDG